MTEAFTHGQEVIAYDHNGKQFRGTIMGVHRCNPWQYDVQPRGESSLSQRVCGIHHDRVRPVARPYLAYERREARPMHILDEA
jgi:hypothetical protein